MSKGYFRVKLSFFQNFKIKKVRNRHFFSFFFSRKAAALTKAEQEVDGASLLRILALLSFFLESSCFFSYQITCSE